MDALILARGGSKGVPRKNIRVIEGKPLLGWLIDFAKKTKHIETIYVSTEDKEIKTISEQYGAKIIDRPIELAGDKSLDVDAFKHFVQSTGLTKPLVHLRATTPIVNPEILDKAIELFFSHEKECTSLRSAQPFAESVYKFFKLGQEGLYWEGFFPKLAEVDSEYFNKPRQCYPQNYLPNGYIDIVKPEWFMNNPTFHGNKILSFVTDSIIEIDTEEDLLRLTEKLKQSKDAK